MNRKKDPTASGDNPSSSAANASSPLFFPQSSSPVRNRTPKNASASGRTSMLAPSSSGTVQSPLREPNSQLTRPPSSSLSQQNRQMSSLQRSSAWLSSQGDNTKSSSPLFFPPSSPALARVGDPFRQPIATKYVGSEGGATFSQVSEIGSDPSAVVRVIWGTNIGITETMNTFKSFLRGFKTKYRKSYDGLTVKHGEGEDAPYLDRLREVCVTYPQSIFTGIRYLLLFSFIF